MQIIDFILHWGPVVTVISMASLGAGFGGGIATISALDAITRSPRAHNSIARALVLGLALIETGAIIAMVTAVLLMRSSNTYDQQFQFDTIGRWGIALSLGICALSVGIASASAVSEAFKSIARQPFFAHKLFNLMLITQSIIQTPVIFSFLIGLIIYSQLGSISNEVNAWRLLAAGLCIGIGSLGPICGLARFAKAALRALGSNREIYPKLLPFSFVSQAIIETPIIFALVTSILIIFVPTHNKAPIVGIASSLAAALAIGIGTLMPGLSSGRTVAAACDSIAISPESSTLLSRSSILVQGIIDTSAVYALLISVMCLIFG